MARSRVGASSDRHRIASGVVWAAHAISDTGLRRGSNEDAVLVKTLGAPGEARVLVAVADGMGGAAAGEVASHLAIDTLEAVTIAGMSESELARALPAALGFADERIRWSALSNAEREGMGTTCTAALLAGERLFVAHSGDSRAYLLRRGVLVALTHDHSYVEIMRRAGTMAAVDAAKHPYRHCLASALGVGSDVRIDVVDVELARGDVILLCSDGLHGVVSPSAIRHVLEDEPDPKAACLRLVALAHEAGAPDNVSCAILRVGGAGLPSADASPAQEIPGVEVVSTDAEDEPTMPIVRSTLPTDDA